MRFPIIDQKATGQRIRELRVSRGMTIRDVQEALGMDAPQALYHWEKGQTLPRMDNLLALSELYGVSINEILVYY